MKTKIFFTMVLMVFLFSLPIFAEEGKINTWAYFQPQWASQTRDFSIAKARGLVTGNIGKFSYLVETEVVPVQLVKAQIAYQLANNTQIIFGQQSNSFKFYNPDPSNRITIIYPLSQLTTKNLDDLGITVQGKINILEYRFSLLNGTGINARDDNKEKDGVLWVKVSPFKQFCLNACWQGGYQETPKRYYREGVWFQADIKPLAKLTIRPTWVKRNDLNQQGWFLLGLLSINSKNRVIAQYVELNHKKETTLGAVLDFNSRMRFFLNGTYQITDKDFGFYIMAQVNIGKDL